MQSRAADACGDTSEATTYYEAFNPSFGGHAINTMSQFAITQNLGQDWQIDRPLFLAWNAPGQSGTVPLWQLNNPTTTDVVYLTSSDASAPTLSGFESGGILNYVYSSQVCGSVPLYAAAGPNDHWYTTNLIEHDEVISGSGWTDDGIAAFVVPLNCAYLTLSITVFG